MAAGDLTLTNVGISDGSETGLKTLVDTVNLTAVTDFLYLIPCGTENRQIRVIKVVRAAA